MHLKLGDIIWLNLCRQELFRILLKHLDFYEVLHKAAELRKLRSHSDIWIGSWLLRSWKLNAAESHLDLSFSSCRCQISIGPQRWRAQRQWGYAVNSEKSAIGYKLELSENSKFLSLGAQTLATSFRLNARCIFRTAFLCMLYACWFWRCKCLIRGLPCFKSPLAVWQVPTRKARLWSKIFHSFETVWFPVKDLELYAEWCFGVVF